MYNNIYDTRSKSWIPTVSVRGRDILNNYIKTMVLSGGSDTRLKSRVWGGIKDILTPVSHVKSLKAKEWDEKFTIDISGSKVQAPNVCPDGYQVCAGDSKYATSAIGRRKNFPCIRTGNCEASYDAYTTKGKHATEPHERKAYVPVDTIDTIDKKEYYINLNENERKLIEQKNLTAHTAEHPLLQGLTKNVRMVKGDDIKNVRIVDKNLIETIIRAAMPITERTREDHDYNLAIQDMLKTLLLNINEGDVINLVKRIINNVFKTSEEALLNAPSFFVELFSPLETILSPLLHGIFKSKLEILINSIEDAGVRTVLLTEINDPDISWYGLLNTATKFLQKKFKSELINRIASMGNDDDLIKAVTKVLKRFTHDAVVPLDQKKSHGVALTDLVNTANKLAPSASMLGVEFHPQFRLPNS